MDTRNRFDLLCPITLEYFRYPICIIDKNGIKKHYELSALINYLDGGNRTDPQTRVKMVAAYYDLPLKKTIDALETQNRLDKNRYEEYDDYKDKFNKLSRYFPTLSTCAAKSFATGGAVCLALLMLLTFQEILCNRVYKNEVPVGKIVCISLGLSILDFLIRRESRDKTSLFTLFKNPGSFIQHLPTSQHILALDDEEDDQDPMVYRAYM